MLLHHVQVGYWGEHGTWRRLIANLQFTLNGPTLPFTLTCNPARREMFSLPFGASSSVFSFTRLALGLNRAGCMIFKFLWSNYLDDYAVFSNAVLQKACETTINAFFHILGIQTSKSNEKCVSFAEVFDCLGIAFLLLTNFLFKTLLNAAQNYA